MASYAVDISEYENDPRLFLFTSLTAGSSHIITATSRLETILKANKIPFQAIDLATDEKARRLWSRRAQKKKLPGLVKDGFVIGDLDEIEEWNEFGELKENIGPVPANNAAPASSTVQGVNIRPAEAASPKQAQGSVGPSKLGVNKAPGPLLNESKAVPLPGAAEMAARNKPPTTSNPVDEPPAVETMNTATGDKEASVSAAKAILKDDHPGVDHLSAPPSALQSGTATPAPEAATPATDEHVPAEATERRSSTHHRGSEIREADVAEIQKIEKENALQEEDGEDDEEEEVVGKGVEALEVNEGEKPQEQSAKEGEDATKSVKD
ncbi:uncharacterized protein LTR77_001478 [Saxophila tyrrhenica]|uniref:Uncharacterized protein n=1 Tax=Saxophila tyrrhenica TaxID=1690608 RepID=A0AAV9PMW5_9PEZI|nr:hypothetical protein LTR77_001478 [Saxophila tyrrhenica]